MTEEHDDHLCQNCAFRVLICGSREWVSPVPILRELAQIYADEPKLIVIHGGARGADRLAGQVAASLGIPVIEVPAEWDRYGRGAGPIRNQKMLDMEPDLVLAFHERVDLGKGTRDMVTRARKAGVEVGVFHS